MACAAFYFYYTFIILRGTGLSASISREKREDFRYNPSRKNCHQFFLQFTEENIFRSGQKAKGSLISQEAFYFTAEL